MQTHKQEMAPIGALSGADYNPRDMPEAEMQKLVGSLREFGFVQPVVARKEDGLIIGGHQRVAAMRRWLESEGKTAKEISKYEVPVVFLDGLDDTRTKVLNLALNKISGEWDYAKLNTLFESIPDVDPALLEVTGFSTSEIENIVSVMSAGASAPLPDEDEIDVDEALAQRARSFQFDVATDADAALVRNVLTRFGMTGPRTGAAALVAALSAVPDSSDEPEIEAAE